MNDDYKDSIEIDFENDFGFSFYKNGEVYVGCDHCCAAEISEDKLKQLFNVLKNHLNA